MIDSDKRATGFVFPADDAVDDARWLADLLAALQIQIAAQGYEEAASVLTDAIGDAKAVADGSRAGDALSGRQGPDPVQGQG